MIRVKPKTNYNFRYIIKGQISELSKSRFIEISNDRDLIFELYFSINVDNVTSQLKASEEEWINSQNY